MRHRLVAPALAWLGLAALLFWGLGATPLTDIDEGAFAEASREMLARGDWVSPWLLDAPRFDKPVLIHWLQMAAMTLFGTNAWGARIPSAIAGLLWVGAIAGWAAAIASRQSSGSNSRQAYVSTLVIAGTTLGIPAMARAATADALLNALMALSLFTLWLAFFKTTNNIRTWGRFSAVLIALGLLTKGPIALLIPAVAAVIAAIALKIEDGLKRFRLLITDPLAWLVLIGLTLPWYWLQFQAQGMAFVNGFFGVHNLGRFTSTMHGFSSGPWYYPVWLLIAVLPWTPLAIRTLWRLMRTNNWRNPNIAMCWGVFVFVVIFFTFSATKLPHYGFYGLSGLLVLMGLQLGRKAEPDEMPFKSSGSVKAALMDRLFIALLLIGLAFTPLWWPMITADVRDPYYSAVLQESGLRLREHFWLFIVVGVIGFAVLISRQMIVMVLGAFGVAACLHLVIVSTVINALRSPIREAAAIVAPISTPVISWRLSAPSLSFETHRVIPSQDPQSGDTVVMYEKDTNALRSLLIAQNKTEPKIEVLWEKTGIQVVKIH